MFRSSSSDSGQISILVLVVALAFLLGTFAIGMIAEVIVAQQRLNAKAETIALAGALELEFNLEQACFVAQEFSTSNYGLKAACTPSAVSIEIVLSESNSNRFLSVFLPNIQATSRAGIVSGE
jgi:hypothetical protein